MKHKEMTADTDGIFRLIQSIPSPKAEPFKQWMAQVAALRLEQMQDPEMSIEQAIADYKRLGYSDQWIKRNGQDRQVRHILRKSLRLSVTARRKRERLMFGEQ